MASKAVTPPSPTVIPAAASNRAGAASRARALASQLRAFATELEDSASTEARKRELAGVIDRLGAVLRGHQDDAVVTRCTLLEAIRHAAEDVPVIRELIATYPLAMRPTMEIWMNVTATSSLSAIALDRFCLRYPEHRKTVGDHVKLLDDAIAAWPGRPGRPKRNQEKQEKWKVLVALMSKCRLAAPKHEATALKKEWERWKPKPVNVPETPGAKMQMLVDLGVECGLNDLGPEKWRGFLQTCAMFATAPDGPK